MKRHLIRTALAIAVACAAVPMGVQAADSGTEAADAIYTHGKVVTVDGSGRIVQAFAVKDGRFAAVGTDKQIMDRKGPQTKVVNLQGRTVIPGLTDSHIHAVGGGPGLDISKVRSLNELFGKLSEAARQAKPGEVIVSNSDWHEAQLAEQRLPTAAELEKAAPGVPVVLVRGGHSYFLNETALKKYNITPDTPVPDGGVIPKDPSGTLTGEITDTAKRLVSLPPRPATTAESLQDQQRVLNSYGLTSVRIAGTTIEVYRMLQKLHEAGKATVRYNVLFWGRTPDQYEKEIVPSGIKQGEGDEWLKVWGVKVAADGGFEGGFMSRPYEEPMGRKGTYYGLQLLPQTVFNRYMMTLRKAGWRVAVHAVGDAAVDEVLQGFEQANTVGSVKGWAIEHAFITRPDQYPRMKALGIKLSVQDHLYLAAPVLKRYWGMDRASQVTPLRTYLDEGFEPAGGTDSPVIPINPFWVMYHFLSRDTISDGVYGADQAIPSRDAMLRVMTINNAKLTGEQDIKGSIEKDKLADFVVLSDDFMSIPTSEVQDLKALATYVGGKQVYKDAAFSD